MAKDVFMDAPLDALFVNHPDPMWIYDLESLRFLAVNNAATIRYGYTQDEFLQMSIADICPAEDLPALQRNVAAVTSGLNEAGVWRHRLKSGKFMYVSVSGHTIDYRGRRAELIAARDVSPLVEAERAAQEALAREKAARVSGDSLTRQFEIMFDSVTGMFLVFSPESFTTVAVSDSYLAELAVERAHIVGRNLFDILPVQPADPTQEKLRDSFTRVMATGQTDLMDLQTFLVPGPNPVNPSKEQRWAITNRPVKGPDDRLLYLIMHIQDLTAAIETFPQARDDLALDRARVDLIAHTNALRIDNLRLADLAAALRTTQRLLGTGTWDYSLAEDRLGWSANVYEMYGVTPANFGHRFADYLALVHPDDRESMVARYQDFLQSGGPFFEFAHQIRHPGGRIVHVHGVAEKNETPGGPVLRGVVQDVTERVESARALSRAQRLLEIAGTSARFGAWRYDIATKNLEWSAQTALIHDEPPGFSPDLEQGISYCAPDCRDKIRTMFEACLTQGLPFASVFEIITAKGRRLWVRSTGEAEFDEAGRAVAVQGSFQDINELVTVRKRAEDSENLIAIAGKAVKLGGWSVSLDDRKVTWSDGIALLHDLPAGTVPTFEGGLEFFAPEERDDARRVFEACAMDGTPFDNVRDVLTSTGNRIKVRLLGEPVRDASGRIVAVQGAMQDISELVDARRQAEQMSQKLLRTFESIRDGFVTIDRSWRFTLVNTEATTLLKLPREDLIGREIWGLFPRLRESEFGNRFVNALERGETQRFVEFSQDLGRWFDVATFPSEEGISVYFQDVTARRQEQERLRLLDSAVERINDIVIITRADGNEPPEKARIVFVNDAFERKTGYTREEAIGQTPRMLQGFKSQRSQLDKIRSALRSFAPVRAELINYTKTGQEYWIEIDIVPVIDEVRSTTHFVAIQRDITERKQAEEALRLSETRFRLVARAARDAVWEWDMARNRQWWSDGMFEIFGHPLDPEEKVPTVWAANLHPEDAPAVYASLDRLVTGTIGNIQNRYRFRRADGVWTTVEDRAFVIRDDTEKVVRILGCMTDISDRLQLEDRLRQSQKLEAVGQLTGGVAHDFNNLLTVIMGNTELLQDGLPNGHPLRRYADVTAKAADHAAELTSRLLAFSRKQALQPRVLQVDAALAGIDGMLRRTLGEDIDIAIHCAAGLWETEVDLGQLEATLLNLAINSRDSMPDGGRLTIDASNVVLGPDVAATEPDLSPGEYVVIAVSDTGQGIAKDQINRVFEPFYTTKAPGKGTGLGLSMVYGFVKQTGGHARIQSELGKGTTVKLFFPRFIGQAGAKGTAAKSGTVSGGHETILVVEDDTLIREQLTAQLAGLGYNVIEASEGNSALQVLRERADIDLLFTDIVLPGGMNGRQIADAARAIRPGLKVLYTSGYSENAIDHHGRLDAEVELLSKPYRRSELADKVKKVLAA